MRTVVIIFSVCLLLAASCGGGGNRAVEDAKGAASNLRVGMTPDEVRALLGKPDFGWWDIPGRGPATGDGFWYYWFTEVEGGWGGVDMDQATLYVSFRGSRVNEWSVYSGIRTMQL